MTIKSGKSDLVGLRGRVETAGEPMSTEQKVQTLIRESVFEEAKTFTILAAPYPRGEYGWVILLQDKTPIRSGRKFKTEERAANELLRVLRCLKEART